jgi:hypothetical protein
MTLRRDADGRIRLPDPPMTGGCQCGRHRYAIDAAPLTLYGCHCRARQRQSASAFGMSMAIARTALRADLGGLATVARASDSGRAVVGRFCAECGTRLFHEPAHSPETVNVKPGTLDDTAWIVPVGWLWTAVAQPSFRPDPDALLYEGQPADMEALRARFRAVYAVPA